jgi:sigma-B regulation protein RsbU (phosphoserine phosphatase)
VEAPLDALSALLRVTRQVGEFLPLDTLLQQIESATLRVLDCERVTVFLIDGARQELYSRIATGEEQIRLPMGRGIAGQAVRELRVVNVPNVDASPDFYPEVDGVTGFQTRNLMSVPLVGFDSSVIGVLQVLNKRGGSFGAADEQMAPALASLTGIAIQRQLLIERRSEDQRREKESQRARDIQLSLLPEKDPVVPGYDIAGWSVPVHEAGGDFYDYLTLPDGRLCVLVADVSGHGLESALVACEARALVRAVAAETSDLAVVMRRTNQILCSDLRYQRFVLMFTGALDPSANKLEYIAAGCSTLLYQRSTGTVEEIEATTLPLAVSHELSASPAQVREVKPGDTFMLVTDGFYEWCPAAAGPGDAPEPFGFERIFEVMRDRRDDTSESLIRALHQAASAFAKTPVEDDLTAVVIKRL